MFTPSGMSSALGLHVVLLLCSQSRKYYFLSEEADEKLDLSQRCRDLERQVSTVCRRFLRHSSLGPLDFLLRQVRFNTTGHRILWAASST